ncbi:MAG: hypothetical protein GY862_27440 [Gammaproteobacteria bacterium]|nr:hypothetical protein [Gammaproteobacteria bacterium]
MERHPLSRAIRRALRPCSCVALPAALLLVPPVAAEPDESGCEADRSYRACFLGAAGRRNNPIGPPPVYVGSHIAPAFADFDADGDQDMLLGVGNGRVYLYVNEGSAQKPVFYDPAGSTDAGSDAKPAVADADGDGDADVLIGLHDGTLRYFKNIGTPRAAAFEEQSGADNPWDGVDVGEHNAPALADLDADGDLDLVAGGKGNHLHYFENTGSAARPVYVERTGADNPWDGMDVEGWTNIASVPALADLDADGDLDLMVGLGYGIVMGGTYSITRNLYFENTGDAARPVYVQRNGAENPWKGRHTDFHNIPAPVDLDADGDLDLVVGDISGILRYFENTGSAAQPTYVYRGGANNPWSGVSVGGMGAGRHSVPALADLDADGDLDLVAGLDEQAGDDILGYFENTGSAARPVYVRRYYEDNPLYRAYVGDSSAPAFADLDADGDLDLVVGNEQGTLDYFENISDATWSKHRYARRNGADNPWDGVDVGDHSAPALADLDADGDLDLVAGGKMGLLHYFENTGSAARPVYVERSGTDKPWDEGFMGSTPALADLDADGDLDLVTGDSYGYFYYFENIGGAARPVYIRRRGADNPWDGFYVGEKTAPALTDLDADGDLDLVAGNVYGYLHYFENTERTAADKPRYFEYTERTAADNPWDGMNMGDDSAAPALADLDADGDLDLVAGGREGNLRYFENTGNAARPVYVERTAADNPWDRMDAGSFSTPALADLDADGDLDLVAGGKFGILRYFENTGNAARPEYVERSAADNPWDGADVGDYCTPALADLDADGDLDLAAGNRDGALHYFENTGNAARPEYIERTAADNPWHGINAGWNSTPALVDPDADGDFDLTAGNREGVLHYFENVGNAARPEYIERNAADNPWNGVDAGKHSALADLNADGDLDLVAGVRDGALRYFENTVPMPKSVYALPDGGSYSLTELDVRLACVECQAIHYTLDGSVPGLNSPVYRWPFTLHGRSMVKFRTLDAQGKTGPVFTEEYFVENQPPQVRLDFFANNDITADLTEIRGSATDAGMGIARMEIRISSELGHLTKDADNPFVDKVLWHQVIQPWTNEAYKFTWSYPVEIPLPFGEYQINVQAIDRAGNLSDEQTVTVFKSNQSELSLQTNTDRLFSGDSVDVTGTLSSLHFPQTDENIIGTPIELRISGPSGENWCVRGTVQSDIGQYQFPYLGGAAGTAFSPCEDHDPFPGFLLPGRYTLQTAFSGTDLLEASLSAEQSLLTRQAVGYAAVIQGRASIGGLHAGLAEHRKTVGRIVRVLKARGFEDENIFYYPIGAVPEIPGARNLWKDGLVSAEELQKRINGSPAPFYLVLAGHGDRAGNFYLDNAGLNESVSPALLDEWLSGLEAGLSALALANPRYVVLGYCYSGQAIAALSKPGRVIITSAATDEESWKGPAEPDGVRSGEFFLDVLFHELGIGLSVYHAFSWAGAAVRHFTRRSSADNASEARQNPLLDADGDAEGSSSAWNESGAEFLMQRYLGTYSRREPSDLGYPTDIFAVTPTRYLGPDENEVDLTIRVNNTNRVAEAFVAVRPPGIELAPPAAESGLGQPALQRDFDVLLRAPNLDCTLFEQECRRSVSSGRDKDGNETPLFEQAGKYELFYFARDQETGEASSLWHSAVYKDYAGNTAPAPFELLTPDDGAQIRTTEVFHWSPSEDSDGLVYTLVLAYDEDFTQEAAREEEVRYPAAGVYRLKDNEEYWWKVIAMDNFGARTESAARRVHTDNANAPWD